MNEKVRKTLVFASLVFAIVYGAVNLLPARRESSPPTKLSTVAPLTTALAPGITAESLINVDSTTKLAWGSDPFRVGQEINHRRQGTKKPASGWHLSGILYAGNNPMAIINKKMVRIGDMVDKARVISIERKQVTVVYKGRKQTLKVSKG